MDTFEIFDHTRLDRDGNGQTLFFMLTGMEDEYKESIKLLLKNDSGFVFDKDGETFLFERPLLEIRNVNLETPLLAACKNSDSCIINLLLINGAKPDVVDSEGNTTLMNICLNEKRSVKDLMVPILKNLIIRGANYEARNENFQDFISLLEGEERLDMEKFIEARKK